MGMDSSIGYTRIVDWGYPSFRIAKHWWTACALIFLLLTSCGWRQPRHRYYYSEQQRIETGIIGYVRISNGLVYPITDFIDAKLETRYQLADYSDMIFVGYGETITLDSPPVNISWPTQKHLKTINK